MEEKELVPDKRLSKPLSESKIDIRIKHRVGEHLDVN